MWNSVNQKLSFMNDHSAKGSYGKPIAIFGVHLLWLGLPLLVFLGDMTLPHALAFNILYVLLVASTFWSPRKELTLYMGIISTVLTLAHLPFSLEGSSLIVDVTNRLFSILVIWITVLICLKQKKIAQGYIRSETKPFDIQENQKGDNAHNAILENVVDAIITITSEGIIHAFNLAGEKMFGYQAEEVIGQNIKILMPSPYREEHDGYLARYLKFGMAKVIGIGREVVGQRKDGSTFPIHLSVSQAFVGTNDQDQKILFTGIIRDLTDQRQKEIEATQRTIELQMATEKSRANERRIEAIVNTAVDPIITISCKGLVKSFNPAAERLFGYSASEVLEKNIKMLMPSPYRELHDGYLARYLETGTKNVIGSGREVIGQRKDGTTFPLYLSVSQVVVEDENQGEGLLFTGIIRDLTHEVQQRKLNADYEGQIEAISKSQMIIEFKMDGTIIKANDKFLETMGYSREEVSGQHHSFFIEPRERLSEGYEIFWEKLNQGEYISAELKHIGKNGKEVWLQASYNPILDMNGKPCKVVKYSVDVSQRILGEMALVEAKLELMKAKQAAELANKTKSEFLANMSHEIRTPMTAILGFTDILLGNVNNPEDIESVQTIKRNGESLIGLINDILDLSKIEAGKLDVEMIDCSINQVVADVASLMRVRAKAKGLELLVRFLGPIPEKICSDPTRLRQVLINVVGNAIKFTETGSIEIITRLENVEGEEAKLQIEVVDTGIGIAEENLKNLFLPFTQADGSTTRKFGGTGLGLTICKRLVELLGGTISVSSRQGKGSVFSVTIATGQLENVPMIENIGEAISAKAVSKVVDGPSVPLKNRRILFAEDGPDNQRLISFILKKAGADVTVADNGQIGLNLATAAFNEDRPFDVILMDMQMPVMDGYEATQALRNMGYSLPIIALTAHAMSTDKQKCLDAGCDDYASKPIDRKKLIEMVASYIKPETVDCENRQVETSKTADTLEENMKSPALLSSNVFHLVSSKP